jgi:hypothetical protein
MNEPLPWRHDIAEEGKCITLESASRKSICSFWGADTRYSENYEWCTSAQMKAHARYAEHALNWFPVIQAELERIYAMEEMPEEAIKAIEALMEKSYLTDMEMPPYAGKK